VLDESTPEQVRFLASPRRSQNKDFPPGLASRAAFVVRASVGPLAGEVRGVDFKVLEAAGDVGVEPAAGSNPKVPQHSGNGHRATGSFF